jgi:anti-sigma regulatory factor (Ser/Thr protein kinase)
MHSAIRLAPDPASAARARRHVEWFAGELDLEPGSANVVATELVANAVQHGEEPIVLDLRTSDASWFVEVTDGASAEFVHDPPSPLIDLVEGGFGLVLVAHLSRTWGVRQTPRGKTVWAELATETLVQTPLDRGVMQEDARRRTNGDR